MLKLFWSHNIILCKELCNKLGFLNHNSGPVNLVWKGTTFVRVVLPVVFISTGNCSDSYRYVRFLSFAYFQWAWAGKYWSMLELSIVVFRHFTLRNITVPSSTRAAHWLFLYVHVCRQFWVDSLLSFPQRWSRHLTALWMLLLRSTIVWV